MHIHHIIPEAEEGPGTYENGLPVCLDCHAEIESRSNMGRRFTPGELREHRERWFATVREHPEVLIRAAQSQTEAGPLEALIAELHYNHFVVSQSPDEGYPPLASEQFHRAIATNALAALADGVREAIHRVYFLVSQVNYHFEEMASMDRSGGRGGPWAGAKEKRDKIRGCLTESIPNAIEQLELSLGRQEQES